MTYTHAYWLWYRYHLTEEDYQRMLDEQGGGCAICRKKPITRRLAVDHDHRCCPGRQSCGSCIRGLLCYQCNIFVGHLESRGHLFQAYLDRRQSASHG